MPYFTFITMATRTIDLSRFFLLNASVKISASGPEVIRIAKTNQTRALEGADLQAMVIVKSHIACKFVNLLVDLSLIHI